MSETSSWRETRAYHPDDAKLRKWGFRIHARPKRGPDVWTLDGVPYTTAEALDQIKVLQRKTG